MKSSPRPAARSTSLRSSLTLAAAMGMGLANYAHAADATWDGDTSGAWNNSANWSATFPNASTDDATFNANVLNSTITLGADITLASITFNTANCEAYTFNGNKFIIAGAGNITVNSTVTTTQTFNSNIGLGGSSAAGTYNLVNNSTTNGQLLTINGTLTGGSGGGSGAKVLAINGAGNILLTNTISRGGGSSLALTKAGTGTLTLSGTNSSNGGTTISGGTLTFLNTGAKATTGTHAFAANTTIGLGVGGPGFFSSANVDSAFGSGTILTNVTVTTTTNVGIDTTAGNFTYSTSVAGSPTKGLAKLGTNTLFLTGTNSYKGVTTIASGILDVATLTNYGVSGALGNRDSATELAGNIGIRFLGGTLKYSGSAAQSTDRQIRLGANTTNTIDASGTGLGTIEFAYSGANTDLFDTAGTRTLTLTGSNAGDNNFAIRLENQSANATSLIKSGTGKWVLSGAGANSYTGLTTVSAGTLALGKSGAVNAIAGGGLTIGTASNTAATVQYTGASSDMMGAGTVTINGRGILDFNGKTDTIGNVAIVSTGATSSNPTPIINTAGLGNLTIGTLGITPVAGFTSVVNAGTGTLTLGGNVTFTAATTGQAQVSGNLDLGSATRTFTVGLGSGTGYDMLVDAKVSSSAGTFGISKSGTGRLTLSNTNNDFAGNVTLGTDSGTLRITSSGALGTGTKTVTNNSASTGSPGQSNALELDSNGGPDIVLASTISFQTSGANGVILNTAGDNTINGTISMTVGNGNTKIISNGGTLTLAGDISAGAADRVLDLAGSSLGDNELSGVLSNTSTPALLKSGAGKWILSNANTFRGTTTITGGTLALTHNQALQFSTINTGFTGGGSLDLTGVNTPTFGAFSGAGNLALPTNVTSITLNPQSGSANYSGNLSGGTAMELIKSGASGTTQVLSGTNTYTGATKIAVGALNIASNTALNGTSGVAITSTVATGGILELANGVTITGKTVTISGYGSTTVRGSLRAATDATATWDGPVVIGGVSSPADTRVGAMAGGTLTISGKISNGTLSTFIVSADGATGKVIVSGANDYTGQTQIVRGTLALGANNSLPTGTVLNVHSGSSVTDPAVFDLSGFNQQVGGLLRGAIGGTATVTNSSGTTKTLTISNTADYAYDSAITGNLALVKDGAAKQTLSGTNTYTGDTTITTGTLALTGTGSIADSANLVVNGTLDVSGVSAGTFTVGAAQTLSGDGTVTATGKTLEIAGTHAVGNSGVGSQAVTGSSLDYADNAIFKWDINEDSISSGFDKVTGTTAVNVSTTGTVFEVNLGSAIWDGSDFIDAAFWKTYGTPRTWTMAGIFGQNLNSGKFDSVTTVQNVTAYGQFTISGTSLTWTAVPEPTSALAGLLLGAGLLRRRRRVEA